ncbi:MAG: PDZ domain-containing protein [Woeseiaceae bacterium]|nr:PDZ domain-containing protein [Woeseiaceae bacterium]
MKTLKILVPAAAFLLLAGQAAAQSQEEAERKEAAAAAEVATAKAREAEIDKKLEEAERRMAEAARTIAELTSERLPQLREFEKQFEFITDERPRLGVNIGENRDGEPVEGVQIVGVTPGSAADDAGLRSGDIITAINGEPMSADNSREANRRVLDFMAGVEEGDILEVEYLRDGKVGSVEVEPRPVEMHAYAFSAPRSYRLPEIHVAPEIAEKHSQNFRFAWPGNVWADMELVELNEGLGKYFGADSGVLVVSAPEADALQLEDGDVILSIDGREPTSVRHALRILGSYQAGENLEIGIMRDKRKRTLKIEVPDGRSSELLEWEPGPHPAAAPQPALKARKERS